MSRKLHEQSVTELKGVGDHLATKLAKLGLVTLQDVLFHLPLRYQDRTRFTNIGDLQPLQEAVIKGEVISCNVVYGKKRSLLFSIQDKTGRVSIRLYHFSNQQKQQLATGTTVVCIGEPRRGAAGLELYHPEYKILRDDVNFQLEKTLTPIYPTTEGVTQPRLRSLVQQALEKLGDDNLPELLPEFDPQQTLFKMKAMALEDALRFLHHPPQATLLSTLLEGKHPAQQRLAMEELLAHHLALKVFRQRIKAQSGFALKHDAQTQQTFLSALPFQLTNAQRRVSEEVAADLQQPHPMLRLVQGDVGSGKTVVAALAALQAIASGYQVAVMAPTEILAEQHLQNFKNWFEPMSVQVGFLSGKLKAAEKREQLRKAEEGTSLLTVGTHALIQDDVVFHNLALVIIDEQHRFGVQQRLTLRQKGASGVPHQLIMTATPIPRTLAMSVYADLDVSVIDELPPGRNPVETLVVSQQRRDQVIQRVNNACREGRQAYWVCTLIEESDVLEAQAAEATAEALTNALPDLNIGLIHGRLKPAEKDKIMAAFKSAELDLLVATTVIEVGVDVPNASLMIIENPERLGLSQLHQLRGRVGRGATQSHCVLLYGSPLSNTARRRLEVMRSTTDGFVIAEQDLEIRGPGEVLGTRQTGDLQFKIADLQRDAALLPAVHAIAPSISEEQTRLLTERWLGDNPRFADA